MFWSTATSTEMATVTEMELAAAHVKPRSSRFPSAQATARNFKLVRALPLLGILLGTLLLSGCAGQGGGQIPSSSGGIASDAMRMGDKITVAV